MSMKTVLAVIGISAIGLTGCATTTNYGNPSTLDFLVNQDKLNDHLDEKSATLAGLQSELAALDSQTIGALEELDKARFDLIKAQDRLSDQAEKVADLRRGLSNAIDQHQTLLTRVSDLRGQRAKLEQQVFQSKEDERVHLVQLNTLEAEVEKLEIQLVALSDGKGALLAAHRNLTGGIV